MSTSKQSTIQQQYEPAKVVRNFSLGTMRNLQNSMAPEGTYRLALNMDSDIETGSLVSRLGTSIVGAQRSPGYSCNGLGMYLKTQGGTGSKLFASFNTATTNTVFDMIDGVNNLTGDTSGAKVRFCSYLDSIVRVNGVDACKAYDNTTWQTSGGAFDLANMPRFGVVLEWKDRIYGALPNSDKISFSSVANPATRTISWTDATPITGVGYIMAAQEDGGGGITAIEKLPGYMLIFKQRTMKRWDGSSLYPEDLVNQGVPSQECVCRSREIVYALNQKGWWMTNGGYPVRFSRPIQDFINVITNWNTVCTIGDDEYVYASIGDITLNQVTYKNVVLKYNIEDKTFDVRSYYNKITAFGFYVDSNGKRYITCADNLGQTLILNSGVTDYASTPKAISWTVETHQLDWGHRGNIKEVQKMIVHSENISTGKVLWRGNGQTVGNFQQFGIIDSEVSELNSPEDSVKGNYIYLKFTGTTNSERIKFLGYEFPKGSVIISQNSSE